MARYGIRDGFTPPEIKIDSGVFGPLRHILRLKSDLDENPGRELAAYQKRRRKRRSAKASRRKNRR